MQLGKKEYDYAGLKAKLHDLADKVKEGNIQDVHVFEGGRKICLGGHGATDQEKVEYNEILNAVLQEVKKDFEANKKMQESNPGDSNYDLALRDHEDIKSILESLQVLKNVGHDEESPSINQKIYNVFRRWLPNLSRESHLGSIQGMLEISQKDKIKKQEQVDKENNAQIEAARIAGEPSAKAKELAKAFVKSGTSEVVAELKTLLTTKNEKPATLMRKWFFHLDNEFKIFTENQSTENQSIDIKDLMVKKLNTLIDVVKELPQEVYKECLQEILNDPGHLNIVETVLLCQSLGANLDASQDAAEMDKIFECVKQKDSFYPFSYGEILIKNFLTDEKCIKLVKKMKVEDACEESAQQQRQSRIDSKLSKRSETFEEPLNITDFPLPTLKVFYFISNKLTREEISEKLDEEGKARFKDFQINIVKIRPGTEDEMNKFYVTTDNGEHWQSHFIV